MYNEILITVTESGATSANNTVLLMEGENDSKSFRVRLPIRLANDWVYIEFEQSNGDKFVSKRLESSSNGEFLYPLKKEVLSCVGELKVQIVIKNESGLIGKSNTLIFTVKGSINATEELVEKESSQELLLDVQAQLDNKQDKLIAGKNILLYETEEGVYIDALGGGGSSGGLSETEVNAIVDEKLKPVNQKIESSVQGLQSTKQDNLSFDGEYNASTNKVATVKTVSDKIAELNRAINENKANIEDILSDNFVAPTATKANCDGQGNVIRTTYQPKTDNTLSTNDKTIVGAINEVKALIYEEINGAWEDEY